MINFIIISITLIVVAVPEGLPLCVTLSLAASVMKMKNSNNLVRKIESVEQLGAVNEICIGKTGVLTCNELVASDFCIDTKEVTKDIPDTINMDIIAESIIINSTARIQKCDSGLYQYIIKGDRIEEGLIQYLID